MKISIKTILGAPLFEGDFPSVKAAVLARLKSGADLCGADLRGADLRGADLCGANLCGADLYRANLYGADLYGIKIKAARIFSGLYRYAVFALLAQSGERYVKMGCLCYSLAEWKKIGIRKSNEKEYPDDGSERSLERAAAFAFAKEAALRLQ